MMLRDYINQRGIPISKFGLRVGVEKRQTMHKYVKGMSMPPADVQAAIARETNDLVLPTDLRRAKDEYDRLHATEAAE